MSGTKDIKSAFPIATQTSNADKMYLLRAIDLFENHSKQFNYIEIGSFLGGSLAPFIKCNSCVKLTSIDLRGMQIADERGAKYDYSGVTVETMKENLRSHGLDTSKLETHDGNIDTFRPDGVAYDLAFIDGEHTDVACIRDFIWTYKYMKRDSLIMFHDSTIVHNALDIILRLMQAERDDFSLLKCKGSEITGLFLGRLASPEITRCFGEHEQWETFLNRSESTMLLSKIKNRLIINSSYQIKPPPLKKAF
ncbi:MAG: hypothetical protein RLZZ178_1166 [Verrucomicrobiota bacterium]|jgi:hypothetical protein